MVQPISKLPKVMFTVLGKIGEDKNLLILREY